MVNEVNEGMINDNGAWVEEKFRIGSEIVKWKKNRKKGVVSLRGWSIKFY